MNHLDLPFLRFGRHLIERYGFPLRFGPYVGEEEDDEIQLSTPATESTYDEIILGIVPACRIRRIQGALTNSVNMQFLIPEPVSYHLAAMYREEVIAKALREHRDKLNAELTKNKNRQKELHEHLAEHQLAIRTLSTLVKVRTQPELPHAAEHERTVASAPGAPILEMPVAREPVQTFVRATDRKGWSRDKLKSVAFPYIQSRFTEEPFEVSKVRDLLDELEPEVSHTYEAAWNLCNDLLREGKLKQAGIRRLPKGIVRLFTLRSAPVNNRPPAQQSSMLAEG